jgi:hypothetical protein
MITFKKFLEEVQYDEMDLDAAIKIINTKCKDAFWMIHSNTPFYRGDPNVPESVDDMGFAIADPSKTERKSANTTNHYTVILDNIHSMREYPKRSKSFICTTSRLKARDFAKQGNPYVIIPFDKVDIGVVNSSDLWDTEIEIFESRLRPIDRFNKLWYHMGLPADNDSWPQWKEFAKECVGPNRDEYEQKIKSALEKSGFNEVLRNSHLSSITRRFLDDIDYAYSPKRTGISLAYT